MIFYWHSDETSIDIDAHVKHIYKPGLLWAKEIATGQYFLADLTTRESMFSETWDFTVFLEGFQDSSFLVLYPAYQMRARSWNIDAKEF